MTTPATKFFQTYEAIDPANGGKMTVSVTHARANFVATQGAERVMEMHAFLARGMAEPSAIYRGIRFDGDDNGGDTVDDWLCYVSAPEQLVMGNMLPLMPAEPGDLFMVFVNSERIAYHWRWEKPDPKNPGLPVSVKSRFSERVM